MASLTSFLRATDAFAAYVPIVSQSTRFAIPVVTREFDLLCSRIELDGELGNFSFDDGLHDIEEVRAAYVSACLFLRKVRSIFDSSSTTSSTSRALMAKAPITRLDSKRVSLLTRKGKNWSSG